MWVGGEVTTTGARAGAAHTRVSVGVHPIVDSYLRRSSARHTPETTKHKLPLVLSHTDRVRRGMITGHKRLVEVGTGAHSGRGGHYHFPSVH